MVFLTFFRESLTFSADGSGLSRNKRFRLGNGQPLHEPAEFLQRELFEIFFASRPLEPFLRQAFVYDFCWSVREFARQLFSLLPSGSPQLPSLDGHSCLRLTLLTVVRVVDLRQLVVAYVGRISLKREPQVNKPAVRALNYYLYKNFRHSTHTGI